MYGEMNKNHKLNSLIHSNMPVDRVIDIPKILMGANTQRDESQEKFFLTDCFNKCIILKHIVKQHEKNYFDRECKITTKFFVPFSYNNLRSGGYSVLIDENKSFDILMSHFGIKGMTPQLERDKKVINLINMHPSIDPFFIINQASKDGIDLPRGMIDLSDIEYDSRIGDLLNYLISITNSTLPKGSPRQNASALNKLLFIDWSEVPFYKLHQSTKIKTEEINEKMFYWLGVIYYQAVFERANKEIPTLLEILKIRLRHGCPQCLRAASCLAERSIFEIEDAFNQLNSAIYKYRELTKYKKSINDISLFNNIIINIMPIFDSIGDSVIKINHSIHCYRYMVKDINIYELRCDNVLNILDIIYSGVGKNEIIVDL